MHGTGNDTGRSPSKCAYSRAAPAASRCEPAHCLSKPCDHSPSSGNQVGRATVPSRRLTLSGVIGALANLCALPGLAARSSGPTSLRRTAACRTRESGFDYLTAVEVNSLERLSSDWEPLEVPSQHYAVFAHEGHLSNLRTTTHAIFAKSLPKLNLTPLRQVPGVPLFLERYEAAFDLNSGWGEIQIWVPLQQGRGALSRLRLAEQQ